MNPRSMDSTDWWRALPKTRRSLGLLAVFLFGMLNFIAFFAIAVSIGGDALNGKVEGGRYFLSSHGHWREVSEALFTYSRWHASSLFVTHPLALLCGFLLYRDIRRAT